MSQTQRIDSSFDGFPCHAAAPSDELSALVRVKRILFPKVFVEGGWALLLCTIEDVMNGEPYADEVRLTGRVYSVEVGGVYEIHATLQNSPKYGTSYALQSFCAPVNLNDPSMQRAFLAGIFTPRQVDNLYEALPDPYAALLAHDHAALATARGIGPATAERIVNKFVEEQRYAKAYAVLAEYALTPAAIHGMVDAFGGDADKLVETVRSNPYWLIGRVEGIGWGRAHALAHKMGIADNSLACISGYISYLLTDSGENGHTWLDAQTVIGAVVSALDLKEGDYPTLGVAINDLSAEGVLGWNDAHSRFYLTRLERLEQSIATELLRLMDSSPLPVSVDYQEALTAIEEKQGWQFTEEQHSAIVSVLNSNVSIITGPAGTGKSSVVSGVLALLKGYTFAQCALSGRAAARLSEVTGESGSTIHRLLGYTGGSFNFNATEQLPYDIIIVDEISMVGAEIFIKLLEAIRSGAKLIMLGDDAQLESIGSCNIFKDMLESGVVNVGRLTTIHRQAAKSAIITESIKVRKGEQLTDYRWVGQEVRGELRDLKLNIYGDSILSLDTLMEEYHALYDNGVPAMDIQIVLPVKVRGGFCTAAVNDEIQALVNPPKDFKAEVRRAYPSKRKQSSSADDEDAPSGRKEYILRLGDRVMVTRNMYNTKTPAGAWENEDAGAKVCPMYNGDRGVITSIREEDMVITFDQWGEVCIPASEYGSVELAYALTCHKLQGSEAPYVIVGLDNSAGPKLKTREWVYTAITRARKRCIFCAETRALTSAISTSDVPEKQTMLKELLQNKPA